MPAARASAVADAAPARQRRKDARPQELLDAAAALFVEKGFARTRSEEVAARAGVSKGTLYLYYPSKEDLFKAVVREYLTERISAGQVMLAQYDGPMAGLLAHFMEEWWQRIGQGPAGGLSKIMLAEGHNLPELAAFYREEVIEPTHELLAALLERGIANGEFRAVPVMATIQVLIGPLLHVILAEHSFGACVPGDAGLPQQVLETQLDLLMHGLLAPREAGRAS